MSYANRPLTGGPPSGHSGRDPRDPAADPRARSSGAERESTEPVRRPRGRPYSVRPDLRGSATLAVGIAIGVVIGASAALLLAPASGERTRRRLSRGARRARLRAADVWDELGASIGDSLREARGAWSARDRGRRERGRPTSR